MSYELFFGSSSDSDDEVISESATLTEGCEEAYKASNPRVYRNSIERDHAGAHDRLVRVYFTDNPRYNENTFRQRFRMSRTLFTIIVQEVTASSRYFQERYNCVGHTGVSSLMKCTSAIRQLAYRCVPDALDEYLQMGATTTHQSLDFFCQAIMELYGPEYLRKPTYSDMKKIYTHHYEKHGFLGMLGSIDCTDWSWGSCPVAFKAQHSRGDHGPDPFILLEAIASQDLWIWHAFFGVAGMNNDVNILRQSPIFNDLKSRRAPDVPFVAIILLT